MTPAELVACVVRLYQRAAFADNAIYYQHDQKAYEHARAAFHEAGRLLDFCDEARAPKTCGTCADWHQRPRYGNGGICRNPNSACYADRVNADDGGIWPADHGCPAWRRKEDYLEARRA